MSGMAAGIFFREDRVENGPVRAGGHHIEDSELVAPLHPAVHDVVVETPQGVVAEGSQSRRERRSAFRVGFGDFGVRRRADRCTLPPAVDVVS